MTMLGALECGNRRGRHDDRCRDRLPAAVGRGVCDTCAETIARTWMRAHPAEAAEFLGPAAWALADRLRGEARERLATERQQAREATAVHVVYYVRTGHRTIKIGTTGHLTDRMRSFRVANPDNLLAAEPGSYELEHERHAQFKKWRYHRRREDFGDADELLSHIAAVRAEHGDPWVVGGAR